MKKAGRLTGIDKESLTIYREMESLELLKKGTIEDRIEGFMMSQQSSLKVLNELRTPKFGNNFLVHAVLQLRRASFLCIKG